jgi:CheY-like chemotaxis protein
MSLKKVEKSVLPKSVIVVEDDAILGLDIEQTLRDHGIADVTVCPSASCTLEKLRNGSYDAIVLDGHLADSNEGWKIAELIDAMGHRSTRIVFQTGSPEEIPDRIRQLGPVLEKPFDPRQLVAALTEKQRPGLLALLRPKRT